MRPWHERVAEFERIRGARPPTLEELVTGEDYFGLATATPLQRAICRIADGRPLGELAEHPHVQAALGQTAGHFVTAIGKAGNPNAIAQLPPRRPRTIGLLMAVRAGKTMITGAACIRQSQVVNLDGLSSGEIPRVSCVSVSKDASGAVLEHLTGQFQEKPALRKLLLEEPTSDSIMVRHPSGRPIEIKVVAGAAAGNTLVSRWSAGVVFDEAPRMVGASEGVVNLDDMRRAVATRMRPDACIWEIGSPWAPFGPMFATVNESFGDPSEELVVIRAKGPWMNPVWWTEERCAELRDSKKPEKRMAHRTDAEGEFAHRAESMFGDLLASCTAKWAHEGPLPGHSYVAAMDPATRGNAWSLVIATRRVGGVRAIVKVRQWQGSTGEPLDVEAVFSEMAPELRRYGISSVETDQWSNDALRVCARSAKFTEGGVVYEYPIALVEWPMSTEENYEAYKDVQTWASDKLLELCADPLLQSDMSRVEKRVLQDGVKIVLPLTPDGRHCDYAPAVVRALRRHCAEPRTPETETAREERETLRRLVEQHTVSAQPARGRGGVWRGGYNR